MIKRIVGYYIKYGRTITLAETRNVTAGDFTKALEQAMVTAAAVGDQSIMMAMSSRGQAVTDIDTALPKGQHVFLAGATGLGKSRVLGQIAAGRDHA